MQFKAPSEVFVERSVAKEPLVSILKKTLPRAIFHQVESVSSTIRTDPRILEVVSFRGRYLKNCPGTRHYNCCGYRILHFGTGCSLGCTYCVLQAYLNTPNLRLFGNIDDCFQELDQELLSCPGSLFRIGTGEFTDSLLLDPWTGFSRSLIDYFCRRPNAVLELKTKTHFVRNLKGIDHGGNVVVAWSLNAESIVRREEGGAAGLRRRLEAARRCAEWGYWLAFHFDPMIEFPGWQDEYAATLQMMFDAVDPQRIVWMSLGALRFMPELKPIMRRVRPESPIPYGEFIRGLDGKMRYFRDIRVEMYSFMVERIRQIDPALCLYLCMEGDDVWRDCFGFAPEERGGLAAMLDQAVSDRMGISPESCQPAR